jgi:hypothetical protein
MDFINPGLLWFVSGASIPVIIHLLNRQRYRRIRWAAMEFLLQAIKKTQRRLRLENLILLLIRMLVMAILAFAIAKPYLTAGAAMLAGESDTHVIFVMDNSYSMNYKPIHHTSMALAKKAAYELLEKVRFEQDDRVSVITMSSSPQILLPGAAKKETVRTIIDEIDVSDFSSDIAKTLPLVKQVMGETKNRNRHVYIITDMQRLMWETGDPKKLNELLKQISEYDEEKKIFNKVTIVSIGEETTDNRAITSLRSRARVATIKRPVTFFVELRNFSETDLGDQIIDLYVDGEKVDSQRLSLIPANSGVSAKFEYEFTEPGPHYVRVEFNEPDYLITDDRRYLALDVKESAMVLAVDGEPGLPDEPLTGETDLYALMISPQSKLRTVRRPTPFSLEVITDIMFTGEDLHQYDYIVLANVKDIPLDRIERLEEYVRQGGGLFITLGTQVLRDAFNEGLYKESEGLSPAGLIDITGDKMGLSPVRLTKVDYDHPMFKIFADDQKGRAKVSAMHFYQYYKLKLDKEDQDVRILARFDDPENTPAFLERRYGEGKVILFNNTLDHTGYLERRTGWNAAVDKPPFFVLMNEKAYYLASRIATGKNTAVGEAIEIRMEEERWASSFSLITPKVRGIPGSVTLQPKWIDEKDKGKGFIVAYPMPREEIQQKDREPGYEGVRVAGIYTLQDPQAQEIEKPLSYFAANIDTKESDLTRITPEEIQQRFPDFKCEFLGRDVGEGEVQLKATGMLWKQFLYLLLGFLVLESFLAWLFGRHKR